MIDRFKFRVWDKIHNRYIYCDFAGYCSVDYSGKGEKRIIFKPAGVEQVLNGNSILYANEDEAEIEQCTGLKDKNGKLIYENDLIKCPSGVYRIAVDDFGLWTVIYENNPFKDVVEWSDIVKNHAFNQNNVEIEVVGNIHENPELMEIQDD